MSANKKFLPYWLTKHLFAYDPAHLPLDKVAELHRKLARFRVDAPEVSIVIPAYNEEASLLNMLSSLAEQEITRPTELLVVNNNSVDRTQEILDACGVRSIIERKPGVAHARQAGLMVARGKIMANADSDCLYPSGWLEALTSPLQQPQVACTYGLYSFLPSEKSSRISLFFYEKAAHLINSVRNRHRAYLNVYGFNFAFRRADALAVGGFEVDSGREGSVAELIAAGAPPPPSGRCEDGLMALALLNEGKGKILRVTSINARAWTSDRRLVAEGSLVKAFTKRVWHSVRDLGFYLSPSQKTPS